MIPTTLVDRTRFDTDTEPDIYQSTTVEEPSSLLDILLNPLLLDNVVPYLSVSSLLCLAATSQAFRGLVYNSSGVFRHLDLTKVKTAQLDIDGIDGIDRGGQVWRNVQLDENLTEDEYVHIYHERSR